LKKLNKETNLFESYIDVEDIVMVKHLILVDKQVPHIIKDGEILIEDKDEAKALEALQ